MLFFLWKIEGYLWGMVVLLDGRPLQLAGPDSERSRFILSSLARLSQEKGVEWVVLVDHNYRPGHLPGLPEEVRLVCRRVWPGRLGWRLWYDRQLPRVADRLGVQLLMLTGGIAAGSALPQCCWMPRTADPGAGEAGVDYPVLYPQRLSASLHRVGAAFCFSEKDRSFLTGRLPEERAGKIISLFVTPDRMAVPLSGREREEVKSRYAGEKEYFFAFVSGKGHGDVLNLLKAFSQFKKRQRSNMQLVVVAGKARSDGSWEEKLSTYKYREAVHVYDRLKEQEIGTLAAAAYAVLPVIDADDLGARLLNAWQAGVPAILRAGSPLVEIAGEGALYADPEDPAALAGQLMSIYKDEVLRSNLVASGYSRLSSFTPDRPVTAIWEGVLRALAK